MKRPSFQFYPGDWLNDAALRMVSVGARGLWIEMLCLMHQGSEYGYLKVNHKVIHPANLARMCGASFSETEGWLEELESAGVFSRDEAGCIYSKRMVRDEEIRQKRAAGGCKGGNPALMGKKKAAKVADNGGEKVDSKDNLQANLELTPSSSSSSSTNKNNVGQEPDGEGPDGQVLSESDKVQGIFEYWKRATGQKKAQLGDKRVKVIKAALKWGYSPRDLCRAIQGCALTPHNQGVNDRGQKYLGLHVCLGSEDQIDRFMANAKAPPVAPEKKSSGQIPGWWKDDGLAQQQAALVGVGGPHSHESRDTFHARIRAAIENGGKPPAPVAAPAAPAPQPKEERVQLTDEQKAANRAALQAALQGVGVKVTGNGITME